MFGLNLAVLALIATAVGTATQVHASYKAEAAQQQSISAQQRAEDARRRAMEIDRNRRIRNQIREGIIARSQALATTTAQGAAQGTGLGGAYGQIAGQSAFGIAGVNLQAGIGNEIFAANRDVLMARRGEAAAGAQQALGSGISSLGGAIGRNAGMITRLTTPNRGSLSSFTSGDDASKVMF